jgi:glycosyltransferase involved in cell wall biosynthesis
MEEVSLSVVIASHNASGVIATCLQALQSQLADSPLEVIVADCSTDSTPEIIQRQFPSVRLLSFAGPLSLARLRGHGIAAAQGAIVAILDPFSVVASDWASQVLAAHARHRNRVIGGSVDLYGAESASYATWTTYLNEYALFMPPVVQGETWILPGSNVSYKRAALFDGDRARYPLFWKTFVNWEQEAGGSPLWLEPAMRVALNKPIGFPDFLRTRYLHGRCFAGMRVRDVSWPIRAARAGSAILVPPLQLWRWTAGFWPKRRHRGRFVATMPAQLLLLLVWSAGEAWGYLRGTGRTCERTYY